MFLTLLVGSFTALGVGWFLADVYRNRQRLSQRPEPEADLTCYELGMVDSEDVQAVGQVVSHGSHAIAEASGECASGGVGHCVEAIAHVISHH